MSETQDQQLEQLYINLIKTINKHRITFDSLHTESGTCYYCHMGSSCIPEHLAEQIINNLEEHTRQVKEAAWWEGRDTAIEIIEELMDDEIDAPEVLEEPNPYAKETK